MSITDFIDGIKRFENLDERIRLGRDRVHSLEYRQRELQMEIKDADDLLKRTILTVAVDLNEGELPQFDPYLLEKLSGVDLTIRYTIISSTTRQYYCGTRTTSSIPVNNYKIMLFLAEERSTVRVNSQKEDHYLLLRSTLEEANRVCSERLEPILDGYHQVHSFGIKDDSKSRALASIVRLIDTFFAYQGIPTTYRDIDPQFSTVVSAKITPPQNKINYCHEQITHIAAEKENTERENAALQKLDEEKVYGLNDEDRLFLAEYIPTVHALETKLLTLSDKQGDDFCCDTIVHDVDKLRQITHKKSRYGGCKWLDVRELKEFQAYTRGLVDRTQQGSPSEVFRRLGHIFSTVSRVLVEDDLQTAYVQRAKEMHERAQRYLAIGR